MIPSSCHHPSVERIPETENFLCHKCKQEVSAAELKETRFNYRKDNLVLKLEKIFQDQWSHYRPLRLHRWDPLQWNDNAPDDQVGMNVFYLLCHGPWQEGRIATLEAKIEKLLNASDKSFDWLVYAYPLGWQKAIAKKLEPVWKFPASFGVKARVNADLIHSGEWVTALPNFGFERRYKILDIWLGRNLGIQSFPIDRHIQRELYRVGLDITYHNLYEEFLVALRELGYDAILLEQQMIQQVKHVHA